MSKVLLSFVLAAGAVFGQYKLEPGGPPASELAPEIQNVVQANGLKVLKSDGSVYCELWFRKTAPSGQGSTEMGVTLPSIPHGALLGAIRFSENALDRRGQPIKPGVYTMRYSLYPPDGNHQGVALQRDFIHLVSASIDKNPNSTPSYNDLMKIAKQTSGGHPYSFPLWKDEAGHPQELVQEGEDWVLYTKIGDVPIGMILIGVYQG
jgi:hypothetical protein